MVATTVAPPISSAPRTTDITVLAMRHGKQAPAAWRRRSGPFGRPTGRGLKTAERAASRTACSRPFQQRLQALHGACHSAPQAAGLVSLGPTSQMAASVLAHARQLQQGRLGSPGRQFSSPIIQLEKGTNSQSANSPRRLKSQQRKETREGTEICNCSSLLELYVRVRATLKLPVFLLAQ
jgi:hypothetical protein